MMKHRYFLSIMFLVLMLSSCGDTQPKSSSSSETIANSSEYAESSSIESSVIESAELTESSNVETVDNWYVDYFVDEFGDTDLTSPFVRCHVVSGEFSNSATVGSNLSVYAIVTSYTFAFKLFEYGSQPVTNIFSKLDEYEVVFKFESGEKANYTGYVPAKSGDRLFLYNDARDDLQTHLLNGESVKVYIEKVENSICNYLFTIDGKGYKEAFDEYNTLKK